MKNLSLSQGFLFFQLLYLPMSLTGQYYSTGQDPASVRWKQIKASSFRIIFPENAENQAQYLANILDLIRVPETKTLNARMGRIPVILHTQSAISNGYTTWAPKRIELYPTPPPDCYAQEWLEQLALHEYRHAVQISKMNQGFTRVLYFILGEQATGGVLGLFIPRWFLEGDATVTETALSNSGRGRIPSFSAPLRAQLLEKKIYRYDKATLGSYKDFVPNSYILGYHLVGQGRERYGAGFWNLPLDRAARLPVMVVPFASGIKKQTSLTKTRFYRSMMQELDSIWKLQYRSDSYTTFSRIAPTGGKRSSRYILFDRPFFTHDSSIVAEKSSLDETDRIIKIGSDGSEKILLRTGSYQTGSLSVAGNRIAWTEYQPDPRWQNRSYSVIRWYDLERKRAGRLTGKSKYYSPSLSPDGKSVCAVHTDDMHRNRIDIISIPGGDVVRQIEPLPGTFILQPAWDSRSRMIVFISLDHRGKTIAVADTASGSIKELIAPSFREISNPSFHDRYVIFNADYSGIENVYALDTATREVFRITSAKFGSRDARPDASGQKIIWSECTSDGFFISRSEYDTAVWLPLKEVRDHSYPLYRVLASQENANIQDSCVRRGLYRLFTEDNRSVATDTNMLMTYQSSRYRKFPHLFNIHSWAPLSIDINNQEISPGVSVMTQNLLSSLLATAGYRYNLNEETGSVYLDLSYQGWYPVFDIEVNYGKRASYYLPAHSNEKVRFTWMETKFGGTVSIPWNFSRGKFYRYLRPSVGTTLINVIHNNSTPESFVKGLIQSLDFSLSASQYLRSVQKDMYPRWGQVILFNYRNTPFSANDLGSIIAVQTYLYFPGIFRHHSFWLYGGIQERENGNSLAYRYATLVRYPSGYSNTFDDRLFSTGINYKLPLFCPDLSIGSVLYIKRFKMNLFFDFAQGWNPGELNIYKSTGATLSMDFHLLRFVAPVEVGFKGIFYPDTGTWGWQVVYSVNY